MIKKPEQGGFLKGNAQKENVQKRKCTKRKYTEKVCRGKTFLRGGGQKKRAEDGLPCRKKKPGGKRSNPGIFWKNFLHRKKATAVLKTRKIALNCQSPLLYKNITS